MSLKYVPKLNMYRLKFMDADLIVKFKTHLKIGVSISEFRNYLKIEHERQQLICNTSCIQNIPYNIGNSENCQIIKVSLNWPIYKLTMQTANFENVCSCNCQ